VFGIGEPAGLVVGLAQRFGHGGEGDARAVGGCREIGAQARHGGQVGALARVGVGTLARDAIPTGRVVVAGVVGAEALDEASLARVAVLAQPRIPAAAGVVGGLQKLMVAGLLRELPRGCGDGDDHLDLAVAAGGADLVGELDGGGELAVGLLLGEECHVVGAGDFERSRPVGLRRDVFGEAAVDQALLRRALLPDTRVDGALDEDGMFVTRHKADVAGADGERGVPGDLPGGVGRREVGTRG